MTWRDTLEIGLKEDAPFRKDNLPESQVRGPEISTGPGRSPEIPLSRGDHTSTGDGLEPESRVIPDRRRVTRRTADRPPGGG